MLIWDLKLADTIKLHKVVDGIYELHIGYADHVCSWNSCGKNKHLCVKDKKKRCVGKAGSVGRQVRPSGKECWQV